MLYVAVPELHGDGETWHLHVGLSQWIDVVTLRPLWYRALGGTGHEVEGETPGSVNAKSFRGRQGALRMAKYIAGYVGKGFERGACNKRVFAAAMGLHPASTGRWHCCYDVGHEALAMTLVEWVCRHWRRGRALYWRFPPDPLLEGFTLEC